MGKSTISMGHFPWAIICILPESAHRNIEGNQNKIPDELILFANVLLFQSVEPTSPNLDA
jgi:hypothetical protein